MGLLRLFGLIDKTEWVRKLESDIYILKKSVFGYLYNNVYRLKFNNDEWSADALIAGALNPTTGL